MATRSSFRVGRIACIGMMLALVSFAVVAKGPRAVRAQLESSMLVTGKVSIDEDGRVSGTDIDDREKVPPAVLELIERHAPTWRFEPVQVAGRPQSMKATMRLLLVAKKLNDDRYSVGIRSGYFRLGEAPSTKSEWKSEPGGYSMQPPRYPAEAARAGVQGAVHLHLRLNRDGDVEDVFVEQVNLHVIGSETQMRQSRGMLAKAAVAAAKQWRLRPPDSDDAMPGNHWTIRVPVEFFLSDSVGTTPQDRYGKWQMYVPGPRERAPWAEADPVAETGLEAMSASEPHVAGTGLRLLTPLQSG